MQSQRWMFTSPGGEDEYKRLSITKEHYAAKNPEKPVESVSGKFRLGDIGKNILRYLLIIFYKRSIFFKIFLKSSFFIVLKI